MKFSNLVLTPRKDAPSHQSANANLLLKAGFIAQSVAGAYSFLPLGLRVLAKIESIVRQEMDRIANEMLMTTLASKQSWQQTNRYDSVDVLFKASGANSASVQKNPSEYVVSPTHEEIVTPIVQQFASSYKDLPVAVYQIQTKFRNEARPKSGLLRGREFRMKDLYSFHATREDFEKYYELSKQAYWQVFERLGLKEETVIALASGGDFTNEFSHEFQVRCETGEDIIYYASKEDVYYNQEVAPCIAAPVQTDKEQKPKEKVHTPGVTGMEALVEFLKVPATQCMKTLIFSTKSGQVVAAAVRGDREINLDKLKRVVGESVELASVQVVEKVTGAKQGYAGLVGLPEEVIVVADESLADLVNFESGANETDYHYLNLNWDRDLPRPEKFVDIKVATVGDLDPDTKKEYQTFPASEAGNIFPLFDKFSKAFNYTYTDKEGKQQPVLMGCYGIGTSRLMGIIAEKFHDEAGLLWPAAVAPFAAHLVSLPGGEESAKSLYQALTAAGLEILWDDRSAPAGVKLADADLIGVPVRLVVSAKTQDQIEWKARQSAETELLSTADCLSRLQST